MFQDGICSFGSTWCSFLGCWMSHVSAAQDHQSTFQLLVSVILSAQTTDKKVNEVTPALFAVGKDAASMAALEARLPASCNLRSAWLTAFSVCNSVQHYLHTLKCVSCLRPSLLAQAQHDSSLLLKWCIFLEIEAQPGKLFGFHCLIT